MEWNKGGVGETGRWTDGGTGWEGGGGGGVGETGGRTGGGQGGGTGG